jgi:MSHA biogenesis protein MshL
MTLHNALPLAGRRLKPRSGRALRVALLCAGLAGCQIGPKSRVTADAIDATLAQSAASLAPSAPASAPAVPDRVLRALLPPAGAAPSAAPTALLEPRFDLSVSGATAAQVFQAIASGSRYSILVPPQMQGGSISINIKDVTAREALETLRELYGFEYRVDGSRIFVQAAALQTRVFQVSYPSSRRKGRSETRVTSGSVSTAGANGSVIGGGVSTEVLEGSQVSTTSDVDFWKDLQAALKALVGGDAGRDVVISPQTGVIVVRAMPGEMRVVESYLRASRLSLDRQVMLEAKIVEVALKEGFESGVNWAFLKDGNFRFGVGANGNRVNVPGSIGTAAGIQPGSIVTPIDASTTPPTITPTTLDQLLSVPILGGAGLLGMAITTSTFAGMLSFLETQGSVHVLSSPRVAAINNQKAVLRVGTDDFFITNVSTTTVSGGASNITTPSITLQPFFSGISLDVTPQIDEDGLVTLHIRPSVSLVKEKTRVVNLGTAGVITLPLASSNINETDTIVRVPDGAIVAIGGLMQQTQVDDDSRVPVAGDVPVAGNLFKQVNRKLEKREVVFLVKPTVIHNESNWNADLARTGERIRGMQMRPERLELPLLTEAPAAGSTAGRAQ